MESEDELATGTVGEDSSSQLMDISSNNPALMDDGSHWWQHNNYMMQHDSGLASAMGTHTPSVCGVGDENQLHYRSYALPSHHGGGSHMDLLLGSNSPPSGMDSSQMWNNSSAGKTNGHVSSNCLMSPITPTAASISSTVQHSTLIEVDHLRHVGNDHNGDISGNGGPQTTVEIDNSVAATAIPELVRIIQDEEDPVVLNQVSIMVFQLSKSDAVDLLIENEEMPRRLVYCLNHTQDVDTIRHMTGSLYNISQRPQGLQRIFEVGAVPCLVRLLSNSVEAVLYYAITTLHNLLLRQEDSKQAVREAGGVPKMVALLQKNNIKFLAICTDCLQILAYLHQPTKIVMLESNAPTYLVHILNTYNYEKLLWTATRVLKVLSVCPHNKPAIIDAGGMEALTRHLLPLPSPALDQVPHTSLRLIHNCLWTLRNLSDAATKRENQVHLLRRLLHLLASYTAFMTRNASSQHPQCLPPATNQWLMNTSPPNPILMNCTSLYDATNMVMCAAGILGNLTCNNQGNKLIVVGEGGIEVIMDSIRFHLFSINSNGPNGDGGTIPSPDFLEACICALRHLTSKHEAVESAQVAVCATSIMSANNTPNDNVHMLCSLLRMGLGEILPQVSLHWPMVKAIVGLLRNVAICQENHSRLKEASVVKLLVHLLKRLESEIANQTGNGRSQCGMNRSRSDLSALSPPVANGFTIVQDVRLEEIMDLACYAIYSLCHDDANTRHQLVLPFQSPTSNAGPLTSAISIFFRMLFSCHDPLQLIALRILADVAKELEGQQAISQGSRDILNRLRQMSKSPHEGISTYASFIVLQLNEIGACENNVMYNHPMYDPPNATYQQRPRRLQSMVGPAGPLSSMLGPPPADSTTGNFFDLDMSQSRKVMPPSPHLHNTMMRHNFDPTLCDNPPPHLSQMQPCWTSSVGPPPNAGYFPAHHPSVQYRAPHQVFNPRAAGVNGSPLNTPPMCLYTPTSQNVSNNSYINSNSINNSGTTMEVDTNIMPNQHPHYNNMQTIGNSGGLNSRFNNSSSMATSGYASPNTTHHSSMANIAAIPENEPSCH